jgi:hypothetical protein
MPRPNTARPKDYRLVLAVSPAELRELEQRAELAGILVSRYVRLAALGERLPRPVPIRNRQAWVELSRMQGNLAQLLHAMRAGMPVGLSASAVEEAYRLVGAVRRALLGETKR